MVAVIAFNTEEKKLVEVALVSVLFVEERLVVEALVAAKSVAVALVSTPLVVKRLVLVLLVVEALTAKKLVEVALTNVPLVAKRLVKYAESAESPPVVEALPCIYREATVVEERVEAPRTRSVPDAATFPCASTANFRFSVQALPFQ